MTTFTAPAPRDRDDEPRSPFTRVGQLLDDLVLEIPRKDQDVVGAILLEHLGVLDRDVRPRQELALLVRVAIDRVLKEIGANAAEVQKRVALSRRAVAGDALTLAAARDKELEQAPFGLVDLTREGAMPLEGVEAEATLAFRKFLHPGGHRVPSGPYALGVEPERAAVRLELIDIEDLKAVRPEHLARGEQREV